MRNTIVALGTGLAMLAGSAAYAMPAPTSPVASSDIVQVYGGCGPYGHPGPYGGCQPGGQLGLTLPGGYMVSCPPGYRLGRSGRACWPRGRRW